MRFAVEGASFSYGGQSGRAVVEGLGFSASSGQLVALIGPNGVGKTTVLRCMLGLQPWNGGESLLDGRPLAGIPLKSLWATVGYVPQMHASSLSMSVLETVLLGRSARIGLFSQPSGSDAAAALAALAEVGLEADAGRRFDELSGGQQRLVLIAKALAGEPAMLVLDEPESGLDFHNQLMVLRLLRRLADERRLIVVMTTHYPDHALRAADAVLLLEGPGEHLFGSADEVVNEQNMSRAFDADIRIAEVDVDGVPHKAVLAIDGPCPSESMRPWKGR